MQQLGMQALTVQMVQKKLVEHAELLTLITEGQSVTFVFVDSTQGWINTMDSTSNVRGSYFYMCIS